MLTKEIVTFEYMKRYNVVIRTARRDLVEHTEKGLLLRVGEGKGTKNDNRFA